MKDQTKIALLFLIIVLTIILFTRPVSAEVFKQNTQIDFIKTCTNSSDSICSSAANCNLSIRSPSNNSFILKNGIMQNNLTGLFNYTLPKTLTNSPGKYQWDMFCCDGGDCGEAHGEYQITPTGGELSQDKAMVYLGMLALLIFIFFLIIGFTSTLPNGNTRSDSGEIIDINNLKYLRPVFYALIWALLIAIVFVASNISYLYLEATMMGDLLFMFFKGMVAFSLPLVIFWFIWIFYSIFQDRQVKKLLERGIPLTDYNF